MSYSQLPEVLSAEEMKNKIFTPHYQIKNLQDKNSILSVIKKKQTVFSSKYFSDEKGSLIHEEEKKEESPISKEKCFEKLNEKANGKLNEKNSEKNIEKLILEKGIERRECISALISPSPSEGLGRISFQQYLNQKLTVDNISNNINSLNGMTNFGNSYNSEENNLRKKNKTKNSIEDIPKTRLRAIDIFEDKVNVGQNKITPKNECMPIPIKKKTSPKNPAHFNINEGLTAHRAKLFLEFLKQK